MFNAAFAELGLSDWRYQRLPVPPELFEQTTRSLARAGFVGANVTIPHKRAALELADEATARGLADRGGQHTHLYCPTAQSHATNTDAPGLIAALERLTDLSAHPSAMVLGAGGRPGPPCGRCARPEPARYRCITALTSVLDSWRTSSASAPYGRPWQPTC